MRNCYLASGSVFPQSSGDLPGPFLFVPVPIPRRRAPAAPHQDRLVATSPHVSGAQGLNAVWLAVEVEIPRSPNAECLSRPDPLPRPNPAASNRLPLVAPAGLRRKRVVSSLVFAPYASSVRICPVPVSGFVRFVSGHVLCFGLSLKSQELARTQQTSRLLIFLPRSNQP